MILRSECRPAVAGALRRVATLAAVAALSSLPCACLDPQCSSDADCSPGQLCVAGFCETTALGCGDGTVTPPEECDSGTGNSRSSSSCTEECRLPICGDGRVKAGDEACDDGELNGEEGHCTLGCLLPGTVCGNSAVEADEECDLGTAENRDVFGACTPSCATNRCGNLIVDRGEGCDEGPANDDHSASCTLSCQPPACGDGERAPGESCDGAAGCEPGCQFDHPCAATEIWAKDRHTIVRLQDGSLVAFGDNRHDAFGIGDPAPVLATPTPIPGELLAGLCEGFEFGAGVTPDGRVLTWGDNSRGARGLGDLTQRPGRTELDLQGVVEVVCGEHFVVARRDDGTLRGWGDNRSGVLGTSPPGQLLTAGGEPYVPVPIELTHAGGGWRGLAGGKWHVVGLKEDFSVWSWGGNGAKQLGDGSPPAVCPLTMEALGPTQFRSAPAQVQGVPAARRIAAGPFTTLVLDQRGLVWGWGSDCVRELHTVGTTGGPLVASATPAQLLLSDEGGVSSMQTRGRELSAADGGFTLVVTREGALSSFGSGANGQLCDPAVTVVRGEARAPLPDGVTLADAKGGEFHAVLLTTDGRVLTCGNNFAGELGSGTPDPERGDRHPEPHEVALCP